MICGNLSKAFGRVLIWGVAGGGRRQTPGVRHSPGSAARRVGHASLERYCTFKLNFRVCVTPPPAADNVNEDVPAGVDEGTATLIVTL